MKFGLCVTFEGRRFLLLSPKSPLEKENLGFAVTDSIDELVQKTANSFHIADAMDKLEEIKPVAVRMTENPEEMKQYEAEGAVVTDIYKSKGIPVSDKINEILDEDITEKVRVCAPSGATMAVKKLIGGLRNRFSSAGKWGTITNHKGVDYVMRNPMGGFLIFDSKEEILNSTKKVFRLEKGDPKAKEVLEQLNIRVFQYPEGGRKAMEKYLLEKPVKEIGPFMAGSELNPDTIAELNPEVITEEILTVLAAEGNVVEVDEEDTGLYCAVITHSNGKDYFILNSNGSLNLAHNRETVFKSFAEAYHGEDGACEHSKAHNTEWNPRIVTLERDTDLDEIMDRTERVCLFGKVTGHRVGDISRLQVENITQAIEESDFETYKEKDEEDDDPILEVLNSLGLPGKAIRIDI